MGGLVLVGKIMPKSVGRDKDHIRLLLLAGAVGPAGHHHLSAVRDLGGAGRADQQGADKQAKTHDKYLRQTYTINLFYLHRENKPIVMLAKLFTLALTLSFSLFLKTAIAQDNFPKSTPEKEGVQAGAISDFINAAGHSKTEFHSFMFFRHGKLIAERWLNPYAPNLKHTLYSTSKSFTAAAVGFALTEKKLKLTDKVISFFPDEVPNPVPPYLAELTVKDVLMMSDGQDPDPTPTIITDTHRARKFFATTIVNEPGTKFLYNSTGTYMLSAIVTKVTGQKVIDYLRPRLFEPLGITGEDWETSPQGANTGGWGLRLKTEDMAKFGLLYLQGGKWNGKQIIPESWVKEATTMKILQDPDAPQGKKDSSDWLQGYCYQMWRCRHNGVRADGAFGQYIIMLPDEDAVIAITAETPDMQEEINLVWTYLLPAMHPGTLPADPNADAQLKKQLAGLQLAPPASTANPVSDPLNGKTFHLEPNVKKMQDISFASSSDGFRLTIKGDTANYHLL